MKVAVSKCGFRNSLAYHRCHKSRKMKHFCIWLLALASLSSTMYINPYQHQYKRLSTIIATSSSTTISATPSIATLTNRPTASLIRVSNSEIRDPISSKLANLTTENKYLLEKLCNHQALDVLIRNRYTKEFLYAAADDLALDALRRRVFTWKDLNDIPGMKDNKWTGEQTWRIEPVDQISSQNSFRIKSIRDTYGPNEFLFANSSKDVVYVRRGLSRNDSVAVATLGSSAKWQLLANMTDNELRGDICNITENTEIRGWVLRNEKYAAGYLSADANDIFVHGPKMANNVRRIVRLSREIPSFWDIYPISTYRPE